MSFSARPMQEPLFGRNVRIESAWVAKSLLSGMVAGIGMAAFAMFIAAVAGYGLWAPVRAITAEFFGAQHAGGDFVVEPVLVGMLVHLLLSAVFGLIFAVVLGVATASLGLVVQVGAGIVWGIVLWAVNTYLFAPAFNGAQLFFDATPAWTWFAGHLVYGAVLGLLYDEWRHDRTLLH